LKNNPDKVFKQIEIAFALSEFYPYEYDSINGIPFHDSHARLIMTKDIQVINNSDVIQKIIISNSKGVKLANKEEFERYIKREFAAVFRKLARTRNKAKKGGLDGQMKITFGRERNTVEAFTDGINCLKAARLNKGLKQSDVCDIMKRYDIAFDKSLLSKMENGVCLPTYYQLTKLAEIYGVQPFELLKVDLYY
jgi:hypothetical protein